MAGVCSTGFHSQPKAPSTHTGLLRSPVGKALCPLSAGVRLADGPILTRLPRIPFCYGLGICGLHANE